MSGLNRPVPIEIDRPLVVVPEDDVVFRLSQLLLLLTSLRRQHLPGVTLERLGYYDFLAANPLLMMTDDADPDRARLLLAGFDGRALIYASPAQRFSSRRQRLQHDLALLVSFGLTTPTVDKGVLYAITPTGQELANRFTAVYARSYSTSADVVVRRLSRVSDSRLREDVQKWVTVSSTSDRPEAVDLLDLVDLAKVGESQPYPGSDEPPDSLSNASDSLT